MIDGVNFTNRNVSTLSLTSTGSAGEVLYFQAIQDDATGRWVTNDILRKVTTYDAVGTAIVKWYNGATEITGAAPAVKVDAIECGRVTTVQENTVTIGTTAETLQEILTRFNSGIPSPIPNTVDVVEISVNSGQIRSTVANGSVPTYGNSSILPAILPFGRITNESGGLLLVDESEVANARFVSSGQAELHLIFKNVALA